MKAKKVAKEDERAMNRWLRGFITADGETRGWLGWVKEERARVWLVVSRIIITLMLICATRESMSIHSAPNLVIFNFLYLVIIW